MEFVNAPTDFEAEYTRVGPLAWDAKRLLVLNGNDIVGSVVRASIRSVRLKMRSSFQHPIVGVILGVTFVMLGVWPLLGNAFQISTLSHASAFMVWGAMVLAILGAYLIVGVLRRRDLPWLIVQTDVEERAFALAENSEEQSRAAIEAFRR